MDRKDIGKKIKALREERGWAQNKLSVLAGVSASYIRDLEKGQKCPTVEVLDGICFAFGMTLVEFFSEGNGNELSDKISALTVGQRKLLNEFLNSL